MNYLYRIFVLYFLTYKDDKLNKFNKEKIADVIIFHNSKIPDYLCFGIKIISSFFVIIFNFIFLISFNKLNSINVFNFLLGKKINLFVKIFKYHNSIYELLLDNNDFLPNNITSKNIINFNESDTIYDLIIVGSGPSGSIIANNLKNKLNFKILDAGKYIQKEYYSYLEILSKYKNAGVNITFGNSQISFVEALCVGGGSEINSGLFHKLPIEIIKSWQENFKLDIDINNSETIYQDIIKKLSIQNYINKNDIPKPSILLKKGADSINFHCKEIPRWVKYDKSSGKYIKNSVVNTYLDKELIKNNLFEDTKVTKLKYNKDHWKIFVESYNNNKIIKAKKIILSAGAISTPQILLNSGIKKNVGQRLQMHPTIKVVALFDEKINYADMGVASYQARSNKSLNTYFGSSISSIPYLKLALDHMPKYNSFVDQNWKNMAIFYIALAPEGVGKIKTLPFFNDPLISYNLSKNDRMNLALGLKDLCSMLLKANAKKIIPSIPNINPITQFEDIEKLPKIIDSKKSNLFSVHIFSSCPIGENIDKCAADSTGKVYGTEDLYVCDSSTIPTATGVNPQGPLMYLTYKFLQTFKRHI
jgi:hypothetical protein